MKISDKSIQNVLQVSSSNIVEIIGEFVELKKKGTTWWGLSPFKNEKTPSFAVTPSKGIFKCFSTGKGGGAVRFLMDVNSMTFYEAIQHIAKKYNITLEYDNLPIDFEQQAQRKDSIYIINQAALAFFSEQLKSFHEPQTYLEKRGIGIDEQRAFFLGFAPSDKDKLAQYLIKNQFTPEIIQESGLALINEKNYWVDRFRDRIIFPIHNIQGKVIGFGGRIITNNENAPKYLNSPETPVFHKSNALYGIFQAKESIQKQHYAILCEGYMDVISLHKFGFRNAVASCGTAFTPEQARLIKRFAQKVIILYDGDEAGIKATFKALEILYEEGLHPQVLNLPPPEDPDSFLQKYGSQKLNELLLNNAIDALEYKFQHLLSIYKPDDPQQKNLIIQELADTIAKISDELQQAIYIQEFSSKLSISESLFGLALRKKQINQKSIEHSTPQLKDSHASTIANPFQEKEKEFLRLFFVIGEQHVTFNQQQFQIKEYIFYEIFNKFSFSHAIYEQIRKQIITENLLNLEAILSKLLNSEMPQITDTISSLILSPDELSPHWEQYGIFTPALDHDPLQALQSALQHYELERIEQLFEQNQKAIQQEHDPDKQIQLLHRHQKLIQLREEIHKKLGIIVPPRKIGNPPIK